MTPVERSSKDPYSWQQVLGMHVNLPLTKGHLEQNFSAEGVSLLEEDYCSALYCFAVTLYMYLRLLMFKC